MATTTRKRPANKNRKLIFRTRKLDEYPRADGLAAISMISAGLTPWRTARMTSRTVVARLPSTSQMIRIRAIPAI